MEKIVNIIISNKDFKVNEQTYSILSNYLSFLKNHLNNKEQFEQAETLISEKIDEELLVSSKQIVEEKTIMSIIGESERIYKTGYFKSYIEDCSEPETKRIFSRSRTDKILGGVCAGFGEYVGLDASIVRVLFVLTVIFYGTGVLLYFILWLVIPENTSTRSLKKNESKNTVTA